MGKKKLLQINITANWGSHGRIAEDIGRLAISKGWESYIAYGRIANPSQSNLIRIGSMRDERMHAIQSRILDNHGLASKSATRKLIDTIKSVKPDIIHLHNIHGYYLNYPLLFNFLACYNKPVVWTLHDCWPFTGHCAHFTLAGCDLWKDNCSHCSFKKSYPKSLFLSQSGRNYELKKYYFTAIDNLTLVPVSQWLYDLLEESFMSKIPKKLIHNGIDIERFKPDINWGDYSFEGKKVVLGVCSDWDDTKGFSDFIRMRDKLPSEYLIILVGLNKKQIDSLPSGIIGLQRTNSIEQLVKLYSRADVFANPTYEDNFPTTNLEAMACGTPVVTYKTGGSPESIDESTGLVVPYGDLNAFCNAVVKVAEDKQGVKNACRNKVVDCYNKEDRYKDYFNLYCELL